MIRYILLLVLALGISSNCLHAQRRTKDTMNYEITIKNILYKGKLYGGDDLKSFKITPLYVISNHDRIETYQPEGIIHIHTQFPLLDTMTLTQWSYQVYIRPNEDTMSRMHLQILGLFRNRHQYFLDTLDFHCGFATVNLTQHKFLDHQNKKVKIPSRLSNYHSEKQKQEVIDSVKLIIHQTIEKSSQLKKLNEKSKMTFSAGRQFCTDTIISSLQYRSGKKETTIYNFNLLGNLRLSGKIKPYYYWWFMRSNHCKQLKCKGCCEHKFYILHRFTTKTYTDTLTLYYENGKKYKEVFGFKEPVNAGLQNHALYVKNAWDTNGVQTLKNGNGYYIEFEDQGYHYSYTLKSYKNYLRQGVFKSYSNKALRAEIEYEEDIPVHSTYYNEKGFKKRSTEYDPKNGVLLVHDYTLVNGKVITSESKHNWPKERRDKDYSSLINF